LMYWRKAVIKYLKAGFSAGKIIPGEPDFKNYLQ
jgi:hypothetical protein